MRGQIENRESNDKSGPVGNISSRIGEGEGHNGSSRPPDGVKLAVVCSAEIASGGEFDAFDSGGVDAEGCGVEMCVGLGEVSTIPCVARVMAGFGEVAGMRRVSVVVWSTGSKKTGRDLLLSSGSGTSVRQLSTRSEAFGDKGSVSGLATEGGTSVVLSWSGGTASTKAVEVESSRM